MPTTFSHKIQLTSIMSRLVYLKETKYQGHHMHGGYVTNVNLVEIFFEGNFNPIQFVLHQTSFIVNKSFFDNNVIKNPVYMYINKTA